MERQRHKEEVTIRNKKRAYKLIKELLQLEEERINRMLAKKQKMVNDDLFARYEITGPNRTKIAVSMSEKTLEKYRSMYPRCCINRV